MDVRAVLLIQAEADSELTHPGTLPMAPLSFADVLGQPVVLRSIGNLKRSGVKSTAVITDVPQKNWPRMGADERRSWTQAAAIQLWRSAEQKFVEFAQAGAEIIFVLRVAAYVEIDFSDLLQFHLKRCEYPTSVIDDEGRPLDIYAISAPRRNEAAFLFRHQLRQFRTRCQPYPFTGYINRLASARDLRQLAIDGLMLRTRMVPEGEQIKPGLWAGRGAKIHRRARVLSPAYIGAASRIRAAAVITRCSVLEHHSVVDCGTVVEDVSTLPYSYIGAGLDVCHSVVGYGRVWNLKRNVEVEFADTRLIGSAPVNSAVRAAGSLASLAGFLPAQLLRGIFAPSHREPSPSLPQAIQQPAAALDTPKQGVTVAPPSVDAGEFPANLVIARRYGNE